MNSFDIAVVGGGHAGIEASVVAAKMGFRTALITLDKKKIGLMSCNPAIGGLAKGQLVREIDALGGIMGRIADEAGIHFKMLNTSKGPAVQSPRAQADRAKYAQIAQRYINSTPGLEVLSAMVTGVEVKNNAVKAVLLHTGEKILVRAVIVTTGTFLNGVIHVGLKQIRAGRAGELPATGLTESLVSMGFKSGRLKTGTPPRIHRESIDYSKTIIQQPDINPVPFSYSTDTIDQQQINCFIAHTNPKTHSVLREGFDRSPMFTGRIKGVGPRYCPSIEDKIDRFADKTRHQLFLEPEGYLNKEVYVNGFSTSLPEDIQERAIKTVSGLENAQIIRLGYAVEYDFFFPHQLNYTLETKGVEHLYLAGQVNGTSGYEEAAAQGFVAGINAGLKLKNREPFILKRSEAYIGVLIDDLINKIHEEPYRMFTSRAEFRLLLRHDNADLRLMEYGKGFGLIEDKTWQKFIQKKEEIRELKAKIEKEVIEPEAFNKHFGKKTSEIETPVKLSPLIKRPEVSLRDLLKIKGMDEYLDSAINEVEFEIKYSGYVKRQYDQIAKFKSTEQKRIPSNIDYKSITSMSVEAREKLTKIRPANIGQAARISGVTPADLSVLIVFIEKMKRTEVPRET